MAWKRECKPDPEQGVQMHHYFSTNPMHNYLRIALARGLVGVYIFAHGWRPDED